MGESSREKLECARQAVVHQYEESDRVVDLWGSTSGASCSFRLAYEMAGQYFRESGWDLFVFVHHGGRWQAILKTLIVQPQGGK